MPLPAAAPPAAAACSETWYHRLAVQAGQTRGCTSDLLGFYAAGLAWRAHAAMGRKSDLGRFAAAHHGAPVTTTRLLTFLAVGFLIGGGAGWIFMGTMHAVRWGWAFMLLAGA